MSKHNKTDNSLLKSVSNCLFSFSCYKFVEAIFKMKLNTPVTKYTDILIFNFVNLYIIHRLWYIMPPLKLISDKPYKE